MRQHNKQLFLSLNKWHWWLTAWRNNSASKGCRLKPRSQWFFTFYQLPRAAFLQHWCKGAVCTPAQCFSCKQLFHLTLWHLKTILKSFCFLEFCPEVTENLEENPDINAHRSLKQGKYFPFLAFSIALGFMLLSCETGQPPLHPEYWNTDFHAVRSH